MKADVIISRKHNMTDDMVVAIAVSESAKKLMRGLYIPMRENKNAYPFEETTFIEPLKTGKWWGLSVVEEENKMNGPTINK